MVFIARSVVLYRVCTNYSKNIITLLLIKCNPCQIRTMWLKILTSKTCKCVTHANYGFYNTYPYQPQGAFCGFLITVYSKNNVIVCFFFWLVSVQFLSNYPKCIATHFEHMWHQSFWQQNASGWMLQLWIW